MNAEAIRPRRIRVWHALQALFFLVLLTTGLSMHYAGTAVSWIPFPIAIQIHNVAGVATALLWVFFPILAPEHLIGRSGLWPIAILQLTVGYVLTLFVVLHTYLATPGETFFSLFREMIDGNRTTAGDQDAP